MTEVDAKEAAKTAKDYIIDVFGDEDIEHVGLEEVKFDDVSEAWEITIGFSRPWDRSGLALLPNPAQRSYKVVRLNDSDGQIRSVTHRVLATADSS